MKSPMVAESDQTLLPVVSPRVMSIELAPSQSSWNTVKNSRSAIQDIVNGADNRLLAIVGPCSIHDIKGALEYAGLIRSLRDKIGDKIELVMRVFLEKPRTSTGWKGLINDPYLDGSCNIGDGLQIGRKLLLDITEMGVPVAMEMLDPLVSNYVADLASWVAIGARTTESQIHRQLAGSLSMPVGFKNSTSGDLLSAVNAIKAASVPSGFLGIDRNGRIAIVHSRGNPAGHLILRGGLSGPNYDSETVQSAEVLLRKQNLPASVVVDCSHMNSGKDFSRQELVWKEIVSRRTRGEKIIKGVMLESYLYDGAQDYTCDNLAYGVSITDGCLGWDRAETLLLDAYTAL